MERGQDFSFLASFLGRCGGKKLLLHRVQMVTLLLLLGCRVGGKESQKFHIGVDILLV